MEVGELKNVVNLTLQCPVNKLQTGSYWQVVGSRDLFT